MLFSIPGVEPSAKPALIDSLAFQAIATQKLS